MSLKLTITLIILNIIAMIFIYRFIRKEKILLKYALIWVLVCLIMILFALTPNIMKSIAYFLGIETASNMVFLFIIGINTVINFILTAMISTQKHKINILIEEIGIIKEKLNNVK